MNSPDFPAHQEPNQTNDEGTINMTSHAWRIQPITPKRSHMNNKERAKNCNIGTIVRSAAIIVATGAFTLGLTGCNSDNTNPDVKPAPAPGQTNKPTNDQDPNTGERETSNNIDPVALQAIDRVRDAGSCMNASIMDSLPEKDKNISSQIESQIHKAGYTQAFVVSSTSEPGFDGRGFQKLFCTDYSAEKDRATIVRRSLTSDDSVDVNSPEYEQYIQYSYNKGSWSATKPMSSKEFTSSGIGQS